MVALLIIPLLLVFVFSDSFTEEAERIAENNGLDGFDPEEPSIYDDRDVELGTNEPDTLTGTNGDDALFSLGQADLVRGLAGDDLIEAGTNNDTVFGGPGDDFIGGGTGFDTLYGDLGDDAIFGNGGDDLLVGRGGSDILIGGGGADSLNGGPGDDLLISGNLEVEGEGEVDVNAATLLAARNLAGSDLTMLDFDELESTGALNGVDTRFLSSAPEPTQGGDLRGGDGDDVLVLAGGDTAEGGAGADTFVLNEDMADERTVEITDFAASRDVILLEYEGRFEPDVDVRDRGADSVVFLGGEVVARIEGGAGLTAADIQLVRV